MTSKIFSIEQIYPTMIEVLNSGGEFRMISSGTSMLPMLQDRQDTIILIKPGSRLSKFDVPLYKREDGSFVLHRIIGFDKNGYIMCGDHQFQKEYGITHDDVIAVLKGYVKNNKTIWCDSFTYKLYCYAWNYSRPFRYLTKRIKRKIKRTLSTKASS